MHGKIAVLKGNRGELMERLEDSGGEQIVKS